MTKPKILVQLDSDPHASVFDAITAVDAGVDQLLQYSSVSIEQVQGLVHGAMFTRGTDDLQHSAVYIGGSDVATGEALLRATTDCFFGPLRVSVLLDASGANTTAAAAVVAAGRHLELAETGAIVLASTGPVGQRVARLLAASGAHVKVASRSLSRAEELVAGLRDKLEGANLAAVETASLPQLRESLVGTQLVIAAGAAGVELLRADVRASCAGLRVVIDLNAVPPAGIAGVEATDKAIERDGVLAYGAIGVGGTKMKIHKAAIRRIFASNDVVLDIDEIFKLGLELESSSD
jgi:hypothetical protein